MRRRMKKAVVWMAFLLLVAVAMEDQSTEKKTGKKTAPTKTIEKTKGKKTAPTKTIEKTKGKTMAPTKTIEKTKGKKTAPVNTIKKTKDCGTQPHYATGTTCLEGEVRPCEADPSKGSKVFPACARTVYENQDDAEPSYIAGTLKLHGCGFNRKDGCREPGAKSIFNVRNILDQAVAVLRSSCIKNITFLCAPARNQNKVPYDNPVTGKRRNEKYKATTCICIYPACNKDSPLARNIRTWRRKYTQLFQNSPEVDAIKAVVKNMKNQPDMKIIKNYHLPSEFSNEQVNNTGAACSIKLSIELNNCISKERSAHYSTEFMLEKIREWQKNGSDCVKAPWCWKIEGEIRSNLSGTEYRFDFKMSACPRLLKDRHAWAFLAPEDVKKLVMEPCDRLSPSQSLSPQIDYQAQGVPLKLKHAGVDLATTFQMTYQPSGDLKLTCYRTDRAEPPATDLNELKHVMWAAVVVWLVQVAIAAILLPFAVFKTGDADDYVYNYRRTMTTHLMPLLQYNAMPDNLVETFLDLNFLEEAAEDYQETRAMIHDHHRASTYNFFGWRTGFDYRLFPCFGEPAAAEEENKCECPECKHVPRINLTKFISPARLIQLGLKDRALVDRKDPLYDTYLALKTDQYLPKDARSRDAASGAADGSGDPSGDASGDVATQPESPPSDKSTLPTPTNETTD